MNSSKNNILKRITDVKLARTFEQVFSVSDEIEIYKPILPNPVECFKTELETISGKCEIFNSENDLFLYLKKMMEEKHITTIFCREKEIINKLNTYKIKNTNAAQDFENMQVAVTSCEYLIARTGSVVVTSASESGRELISFPPIHIVIANSSQIVNYVEDAYKNLQEKYKSDFPSQITTITGPSRTADIEKTLVLGAHGPKEFVVLLLNKVK